MAEFGKFNKLSFFPKSPIKFGARDQPTNFLSKLINGQFMEGKNASAFQQTFSPGTTITDFLI